jgi:TolB protein
LTDAKNEYHSRPVYSPKGDKIIFLSKSLQNQQSDICLLDIESKMITKITKGETYVTEAAFSPIGDKIIYCGAGYLGNYSPVARKAPHDLDLFSINTDGTGFKKLTNLSAYELSSISLSRTGDSVLCELTEKQFEGIYLMSLTDTTIIMKIEADHNPRPQIGNAFYGNPVFSKDYKNISFMAPYQLYTLNLADKKYELIWDNTKDEIMAMPIHSRFLDSDKKIIFSILKIEHRQYTTNAEIIIVDLKTKKTETLEIK